MSSNVKQGCPLSDCAADQETNVPTASVDKGRARWLAVSARVLGIGLSGLTAWQAVRYYQGEIAIPVYDQAIVVLTTTLGSAQTTGSNLAQALNLSAVLGTIQTLVGMAFVLTASLLLLRWFDVLGWRAQLGRARFAEHQEALRRTQEELARRMTQKPARLKSSEMSWFAALIFLGLIGAALSLAATLVAKLGAYMASIGVTWVDVGDLLAITAVLSLWIINVAHLGVDWAKELS